MYSRVGLLDQSRGYVFDSTTLTWVASPAPGGSTTVNISSLAGAVIARSSAADLLGTVYQSTFADFRATVHNSTIGDLLASVQQNSTTWLVQQTAASTFVTAQVNIPTPAVQIVAANAARHRLILTMHGNSTESVYLGNTTSVTATDGLKFAGVAGNQIVIRSKNLVAGVTNASTQTISYLEESY